MLNKNQEKKLVTLIQQDRIQEFFKTLGDYNIKDANLAAFKKEYISGKYGHDFHERLHVYINQLVITQEEIQELKIENKQLKNRIKKQEKETTELKTKLEKEHKDSNQEISLSDIKNDLKDIQEELGIKTFEEFLNLKELKSKPLDEYLNHLVKVITKKSEQITIEIEDTVFLFRHFFMDTLKSDDYKNTTFIATSIPKKEYFWQVDEEKDTNIVLITKDFIKSGGTMERIFLIGNKNDLKSFSVLEILSYHYFAGIQVYTVLSEKLNPKKKEDELFFADMGGAIAWEANIQRESKKMQSIDITLNKDKINNYIELFNRVKKISKLFTPIQEKYIQLQDNFKLCYTTNYENKVEENKRKNLIFIGGWRMSKEWWVKQHSLVRKFDCYFLDMRGYGGSDKTDSGNNLKTHAEDVKNFIKTLSLEDVYLIGWSSGASTIFSYLENFQKDFKISGAVLIDQSPKIISDKEWRLGLGTGVFEQGDKDKFIKDIENNDVKFVRDFIPTMFAEEYRETLTEEELKWMTEAVLKMPTNQAVELLSDHMEKDWRSLLNKITIKPLIITGQKSGVFPPESGKYLEENIKGAEQVVFEESGHLPFYEEFEKFNEIISNYIQKK